MIDQVKMFGITINTPFELYFQRLDGRQPYDYRKTKIKFGIDRGCCQVQLGDTL